MAGFGGRARVPKHGHRVSATLPAGDEVAVLADRERHNVPVKLAVVVGSANELNGDRIVAAIVNSQPISATIFLPSDPSKLRSRVIRHNLGFSLIPLHSGLLPPS
jgi:hypothetical protein